MLWTNFEKDLATFDWTNFLSEHCHIDIWGEDFKPSSVFGLEDEIYDSSSQLVFNIKQTFHDWISSIDTNAAKKKLRIDMDSFYLNFNYTLTLETLYQIDKQNVFHIHGDIDSDPEELIFGHGATILQEPELDKNGDSNRTIFTDSENAAKYPLSAFYKPVSDIISRYSTLFEEFSNTNTIYILGHSLNSIDIPYFQIISTIAKNAEWNVSYFLESEKEIHLTKLKSIGVPLNKIKLSTLDKVII